MRWDITFLVHTIAGRGLMGEECAFLESQPQWNMSKQPQAADLLGCITGVLAKRNYRVRSQSLGSGFC